MSHYLIALQGNHWFSLPPEKTVTIGSDKTQTDWAWSDESVSPQHARLSYRDQQWWIEDLHSTDGTYVQGQELPPAHATPLGEGHRVSLGLREFLFTSNPPIQPLSHEVCQSLLAEKPLSASPQPGEVLRYTLEQMQQLMHRPHYVHQIIEQFLSLLQSLLHAHTAVLSLENQIYLRGISDTDPHTELVLNRVRFQTQPIAFCSALQPSEHTFSTLYAPLIFEDLMRGYVYIRASEEQTWTPQDFATFAALTNVLNLVLSTQQQLERAQEDREMLNLNLVGIAPLMQQLKIDLLRMAPRSSPVMVCGEKGVGKSRIARAVHQASPRRDAPLVVINLANLPPEILESELCGFVQTDAEGLSRKRTGKAAKAHQGSLLIEEISELPLGIQPTLLGLIQNGIYTPVGSDTPETTDIRVLVTSQYSLQELVQQNKLMPELADIFAFQILQVPSLQQRKEDLPQLFRSFLARFGEEEGLPTCVVKDEALVHLQRHRWTGNIRELREIVARCFYKLDPTHPVIEESLMLQVLQEHQSDQTPPTENILANKVRALEAQLITEALMAANDDIVVAAQSLGISRIVLQRKMREIGIG